MRILLIDNHDSYTYNLFQLIAEVTGDEPEVVRNDGPQWADLDLDCYSAAVISPGPGHPARPRDFGNSSAVLTSAGLPVLGVCLGHQGIGHAAGATVARAPRPRHGHLTRVRHTGEDLFDGIPQDFVAVRYHSLCVPEPLPAQLQPTAWAEDGVLMGLRHRRQPWWGVQFHPESVASAYGRQMIVNFTLLAASRTRPQVSTPRRAPQPPAPTAPPPPAQNLQAQVVRLERALDPERIFERLFSDQGPAFWLDSSMAAEGLSRFSFLGDGSGPLGERLTYRVGDGSVLVEPNGSVPRLEPGSIFDVLQRRIAARRVTGPQLPFDLVGGYVGFFGYELKDEPTDPRTPPRHRSRTPDAVWMFADRYVAIDHTEGHTYLVAVADPADRAGARAWLDQTRSALTALSAVDAVSARAPTTERPTPGGIDPEPWLVRDRSSYLADVGAAQRQLRAGESYEICLTNQVRLPAPRDDLAFYRRLRRLNPAPYAAFLRLGELAVFSSSPERFLRLDPAGIAQSRPIKGTAPRSADPELDDRLRRSLPASAKTRAENLMIVDLVRNDLGQVCEVGSVAVEGFMATESYATVHQLVSTIRGRLRPGISAVAAARACFPAGSMTGAPKERTMRLIDELETTARGVYSGALGYFGLNGTADLSVVIRTAVRWRDELTIGAGGAIVLDSDPAEEYAEMLLKAATPLLACTEDTPLPA